MSRALLARAMALPQGLRCRGWMGAFKGMHA
jgi:hypothetical protein